MGVLIYMISEVYVMGYMGCCMGVLIYVIADQ